MQKISLKKIPKFFIFSTLIFLMGCGKGFFKPGDARVVSPDPKERVKKSRRRKRFPS